MAIAVNALKLRTEIKSNSHSLNQHRGNYYEIRYATISILVPRSLRVGLGFAQYQSARIIVKGVTPDVKKTGRYDALSSGLPNVGKGQKVWLEAQALYGSDRQHAYLDTILTQNWTLTRPDGFFATILYTDTTTSFIPDTIGQYKVDVALTTNHGGVNASIYVNSAEWVGVGNIVGTPDPAKGQCAAGCHSTKVTEWENTGHAGIFAYNVDSSTHYSANCVSCHTVGYDTAATAVNGGWDDVAASYGFTIPSPQHPGVWDSIKTNFPNLANVSNIQCENCHGPGSLHIGATTNNRIASSFSAVVCGQCHDRSMGHIKNYEWNRSLHAVSMAEGDEIEYMNRSSCARCHTGQGFVYETIEGQVSAAPYDNPQPVTCAACHDPHSDENPLQLRQPSIGEACDGCHITRISSRGLHGSPQSPMLNGSNGTPYVDGQTGVGTFGGWQFPGYDYPNSSHTNIADRCAECHMAIPAETVDTVMVPAPYSEWRGKLGGHTFKVVWDRDTPDDPADDLLNPFGCKECHGNVSLNFVEESQEKIHALLDELATLLPHRTSGDTTQPKPHTDASLTLIQKVASYNWYFVNNDGSYGVHNHLYATALLNSSIEMLQLGAGAADIASITDVPNDQGKQVQVVWNKFPAENYPDPVTKYLVLRQDSAGAFGKTNAPVANSFRDMLSKAATNSHVILAGSVWTKVGEFEAIDLPQYSLVVPTLYDSTIVSGLLTTTFEVVGMTTGGATYTSAPASGYSVDNLAPAPPAGFAAVSVGGVVNLTWEASTDKDFKYFAVYRGTTPGFTPSGNPLATTTTPAYDDAAVQVGNTYYYKLTAFDFSSNESNLSDEIAVTVTSVGDEVGIPTEFALRQNYPNPFNPSTVVKYQLPAASHVKITVYNTLGKLVTTLVDQDQSAGYYNVRWNGTDDAGISVASGIYFYRMEARQTDPPIEPAILPPIIMAGSVGGRMAGDRGQAGSFTDIKKMMFIK